MCRDNPILNWKKALGKYSLDFKHKQKEDTMIIIVLTWMHAYSRVCGGGPPYPRINYIARQTYGL
jgi:hypothetical protein